MNVSTDRYVCAMRGFSRRSMRADRRLLLFPLSEAKDVHDSPIGPSAAAGPSVEADAAADPQASQGQADGAPQVISNARGPFPRLELYSVPRRSHTIHGTGHRRDASWGTFGSATGMGVAHAARPAAIDSIVRRLADVSIVHCSMAS